MKGKKKKKAHYPIHSRISSKKENHKQNENYAEK